MTSAWSNSTNYILYNLLHHTLLKGECTLVLFLWKIVVGFSEKLFQSVFPFCDRRINIWWFDNSFNKSILIVHDCILAVLNYKNFWKTVFDVTNYINFAWYWTCNFNFIQYLKMCRIFPFGIKKFDMKHVVCCRISVQFL